MQSLSYAHTSSRLSASILNPFGMLMSSRSFSIQTKYRYGFNGKELDSDFAKDNYDFGARIYDGRIGRWLAVDPLWKEYLSYSPFSYSINSPILFIDGDGRKIIVSGTSEQKKAYIDYINSNLTTFRVKLVGDEMVFDDAWDPTVADPNYWSSPDRNKSSEFDEQMASYMNNKKKVTTKFKNNSEFMFTEYDKKGKGKYLDLDDFTNLSNKSAGFGRALIASFYASNLLTEEEAKNNEAKIINDEYVPKQLTNKQDDELSGTKLIVINPIGQTNAEKRENLDYSNYGDIVDEVEDNKTDLYTGRVIVGKKEVLTGYYFEYDYKGIKVSISTDLKNKVINSKVEAKLVNGTYKELK